MNQIINMIIRQVMRQLVNRGVNAGFDQAAKLSKKRPQPAQNMEETADGEAPQMTRAERQAKRAERRARREARQSGAHAKQSMKALGRISKF